MTHKAELRIGNLFVSGEYDTRECPDTARWRWRFQYTDTDIQGTHVSKWLSSQDECKKDAVLRGIEFI